MGYALIDSGHGRKLERFGDIYLSRPSSQALWSPKLSENEWQSADATLLRETDAKWIGREKVPEEWTIPIDELIFKLKLTDFGHVGIFPEQRPFWNWIASTISDARLQRKEPIQVLNLFAYSGGSTLAAASAGAHVCHLDASKGMVTWAKENADLNGLSEAPIRWIVDDVTKFIARELRRERRYDAIILDPPSFGRGPKGELFKIEERMVPLLEQCRQLLSDHPLFMFLSCHTPGITPTILKNLLEQQFENDGGKIDQGEMLLEGENNHCFPLPSGTFARWTNV